MRHRRIPGADSVSWGLGRGGLQAWVGSAAVWVVPAGYAGSAWWLFAQGMAGRPLLALP